MNDENTSHDRRAALLQGGKMLAAIAVVAVTGQSGLAAAQAKKKGKAAKDDFFFQEEPGEGGKNCAGCINFTPKSSGQYGADSGDCALLVGDVCSHCYCQGWTDKRSAGAKKAGT
jgi:hypothetical protein